MHRQQSNEPRIVRGAAVALVALAASACGPQGLTYSPAYLAVSTDVLDFGEQDVGSNEERSVYLINTGEVDLHLDGISGDVLGGVFTMVIDTFVIPGNSDAVARVHFQPSEEVPYTTTFEVDNDSANEPSLLITVSGIGVHREPCEGVVCQTPPNECYEPLGTCVADVCVYAPLSDVVCNDDDPCTLHDTCAYGLCRGTAIVCDAPPPSYCSSASLRVAYDPIGACTDDGTCAYTSRDVACDFGCESSACAGDPCAGESCDDGNPCTQDSCSPTLGCQHSATSGAACVTGSGECPQGHCVGDTCLSDAGVICKAEYDLDLCTSVDIAGVCTAAGSCEVDQVPAEYTCPGCNGICIKCLVLQYCLPIR